MSGICARRYPNHHAWQSTIVFQIKFLGPIYTVLALPLLLATPALADPIVEAAGAATVVSHEIEARIDPAAGTISVTDRLTPPKGLSRLPFTLHAGLNPEVIDGDALLEPAGRDGHLQHYRLTRRDDGPVSLRYAGRIRHGMEQLSEGMGRVRTESRGTIDAEGVYLDGWSGWYPRVPGTLQRFTLQMELPKGWLAVSQGAGPAITEAGDTVRIQWAEGQPQDDIHLNAGHFFLYRRPTPVAEAQAWLRGPDDALAERYLTATAEYLTRYSALIGPYPYAKFALVENFWETGYGMPSFTLLGPQVLRLPFILHSSYPHEILHNWWGNGVYIDYAGGNWSEGLTAYLADHLNQELDGHGADYRRDQLKAYADYVRDSEDFPLSAFRGRHGSASQAIGYGKSLMLFHMLRIRLGDDAFVRGLRQFYRDNLFTMASYDDIQRAFEGVSGEDLAAFFAQWTQRTGAPALALSDVKMRVDPVRGFLVSVRLEQTQAGPPFPLVVPVVVHAEGVPPQEQRVELTGRDTEFELESTSRPLRVAVDPRFDTFRALAPGESAVSLSNLFGAQTGLFLIPSAAPADERAAWQALASQWQQGHPGWQIRSDDEIAQLPEDRALWLFGWENRFLRDFTAAAPGAGVDATARTIRLGGETYDESVSAALTARRGAQPLGWVAASTVDAVPGLARKLPHYGKYGYLLFDGAAPANRLKGQWGVTDSPLMHWFGDARQGLEPPPRPSLLDR